MKINISWERLNWRAQIVFTFCAASIFSQSKSFSTFNFENDWIQKNISFPNPLEWCDSDTSFQCEEILPSNHLDEQELNKRTCLPLSAQCDGVPNCPGGQDEAVQRCGCLANEFRCHNDTCIDLVHRCDRKSDCAEGEDEIGCEAYKCPETFSKCKNHFCFPDEALCDFVDDCGDQTDEENCVRRVCWNGEFKCESGECGRPGFICDGKADCKDGSDEWNCTEDFFRVCADGKRIHKYFWCDGKPDCPDNHADEINCNCSISEDVVKCPNDRCVSSAQLCDGICDCLPISSEVNTFLGEPLLSQCFDENDCQGQYIQQDGMLICLPNVTLPCISGEENHEERKIRCLNARFVCNNFNDCVYDIDEFNCNVEQPNFTIPDGNVSWFRCMDGRVLPQISQCDHRRDCVNGEDEFNCDFPPCSEDKFRCLSGECIPMSERCNAKPLCEDASDEIGCANFTCRANEKRCIFTHQCIPKEFWCDHFIDCPDQSDERNCTYRKCGADEFTCSNGQCIPKFHQCYNSGFERDSCSDNSHLRNCVNWTCSEDQFKCWEGPCLSNSLKCNEYAECPQTWMDENGCPFQCSRLEPRCLCQDVHINCSGIGLTHIPPDIEREITKFNMRDNYLNESLNISTFKNFGRLISLSLRNNSIRHIEPGTFRPLWCLAVLDLQGNQIEYLQNGTFFGLASLMNLHLESNLIHSIEPMAFLGLSSLTTLDLSHQRLVNITHSSFVGLRSLSILDLSHNRITHLVDGVLNGLPKLIKLNLTHNTIQDISGHVFGSVASLKQLYTDEFRLCCLVNPSTKCEPKPDEFSSCEDLMSNLVLRVCVWVLGCLATLGNAVVIIWRLACKHDNQVHSFLITNLALGDMVMGTYLLVIAAADAYYRGVYFIYDADWRSSRLCQFAGFLSTFSSELSVFTLTVITLDRFLVIIFPFRMQRLEMPKTRLLMAIGWLGAAFLAGLPLFEIHYFRNFYGRSGVCLALHITSEKPSGWEYSVFVFLVLNLASFTAIAVGYAWMYAAARTTQRAAHKPSDAAMARRMTLIVATDAACWMPIIFLGALSLAGMRVPPQVFAWVAVFILPLNAAVNPVLYTLGTPGFIGPARHGINNFSQRSGKLARRRTFSSTIGSTLAHNSSHCELDCGLGSSSGVGDLPFDPFLSRNGAGSCSTADSFGNTSHTLTSGRRSLHCRSWSDQRPLSGTNRCRASSCRGQHTPLTNTHLSNSGIRTAVVADGEIIPLRHVSSRRRQ